MECIFELASPLPSASHAGRPLDPPLAARALTEGWEVLGRGGDLYSVAVSVCAKDGRPFTGRSADVLRGCQYAFSAFQAQLWHHFLFQPPYTPDLLAFRPEAAGSSYRLRLSLFAHDVDIGGTGPRPAQLLDEFTTANIMCYA